MPYVPLKRSEQPPPASSSSSSRDATLLKAPPVKMPAVGKEEHNERETSVAASSAGRCGLGDGAAEKEGEESVWQKMAEEFRTLASTSTPASSSSVLEDAVSGEEYVVQIVSTVRLVKKGCETAKKA